MSRNRLAFLMAFGLALFGSAVPARAQLFPSMNSSTSPPGNIEGFTVVGQGSVAARPNRLEIDLDVSAASELSADAIVKYRDAKKRLQDAFAALKLGNVTVEERGLLIDQKGAMANPYYFDYQPTRRGKAEVQLTRKLVIKCTNIRALDEDALLQLVAKLLDVAQDAGGKVGSQNDNMSYYYYERFNRASSLVRYILDDYDKLIEEAYGKAVEDATTRASRLARLSRVKLGPIAAIRETSVPGERAAGQDDEASRGRHLESARFQEIPVRVELLVRFNTEGSAPAAAPGGRTGQP